MSNDMFRIFRRKKPDGKSNTLQLYRESDLLELKLAQDRRSIDVYINGVYAYTLLGSFANLITVEVNGNSSRAINLFEDSDLMGIEAILNITQEGTTNTDKVKISYLNDPTLSKFNVQPLTGEIENVEYSFTKSVNNILRLNIVNNNSEKIIVKLNIREE